MIVGLQGACEAAATVRALEAAATVRTPGSCSDCEGAWTTATVGACGGCSAGQQFEALQRAWGLQRLRLGASDCEGAWGCSWAAATVAAAGAAVRLQRLRQRGWGFS